MSLRETLMQALKSAMLARHERDTATLRMVVAKLRERDIEARPSGNKDGIADAEIMAMLEGMIKQRRESVALYEKGGRADLAQQENEEITVIERFLPQKLDVAATAAAIDAAIAQLGASGIRDMGRVMAALKESHAGQLDFASVGAMVKARLSA
jgi:uncharacterized protein